MSILAYESEARRVTLEQEVASIIAFVLAAAGNPRPYYYDVPEEFNFPAMYFPTPEIKTRGETFRTYASGYVWYINVMAETTEKAHELGLAALTKLKQARNLVPLINESGEPTGKKLRLDDPQLHKIDSGVVQLTIEWTSRRPYDAAEPAKMQAPKLNFYSKEDLINGE